MYLTYDAYLAMDGELDEEPFARLEAKARQKIDSMTFGRLVCDGEPPENVKYCMFELIAAMESDEAATGMSGREIASMSNDGVTVTYASGSQSASLSGAQARYSAIVRAWLSGCTNSCGTPLFYAGVTVG